MLIQIISNLAFIWHSFDLVKRVFQGIIREVFLLTCANTFYRYLRKLVALVFSDSDTPSSPAFPLFKGEGIGNLSFLSEEGIFVTRRIRSVFLFVPSNLQIHFNYDGVMK